MTYSSEWDDLRFYFLSEATGGERIMLRACVRAGHTCDFLQLGERVASHAQGAPGAARGERAVEAAP